MLGRDEIKKQVKQNNLITEYNPECLESCGYDLRLGKIYKIKGGPYLGIEHRSLPQTIQQKYDEYSLNPGEYVLIETIEKVNMPANLAARILPRSTIFRCGAALYTALVDPGYQGTLTMGLKNHSNASFRIQRKAKIAQIVFENVQGKTKKYDGRYQGGKIV
ncbi:MAG: dCTP deaminase [Candidatus Altiarchaeales archaeon ex4484_96]|nr:MAG: dCTP deaminase [Candidatus Altiarchaeales archaeon ex4484_96]